MSILLTKTLHFLQLAGTWIKGHWMLLLLAGGLIYAFFFVKNKSLLFNDLLKQFKEQQETNAKELDELKRIQQEQIVKQQEINARYNEVLDRIQKNYAEQLRTLDSEKESNLRHIIEVNRNNPTAMASDINALFGIPIYPLS